MAGDLDNLENKLRQFRADNQTIKSVEPDSDADIQSRNIGLQAGGELVACVAAGPVIGWLLDRWLHTDPLFLIVFLFAGIGTGFYNVYRLTQSPQIKSLHTEPEQGKNPATDD